MMFADTNDYIPPLFSSFQKEKFPTSKKKQENLQG